MKGKMKVDYHLFATLESTANGNCIVFCHHFL